MRTWVNLNHGRWCVPCPSCNSSFHGDGRNEFSLQWGQPSFVCSECHAGPFEIVWPASREAIEDAVRGRPVPNQNWIHGETIGRLEDDNRTFMPATDAGLTVIEHG